MKYDTKCKRPVVLSANGSVDAPLYTPRLIGLARRVFNLK